jgi:hypothetical protein
MRGASTAPQKRCFKYGLPHSAVIASDAKQSSCLSREIWIASSLTLLAMTTCGSTDAGGEDVGYFVHWKKRVRIPPLTRAL